MVNEPDADGPGRCPPPVSEAALMRMATFHLARHSASTRHLREILARKIRRRCRRDGVEVPTAGSIQALIDPVLARLSVAGLLDDAKVASGRAAALAARGRPAWRIRAELDRQGLDAGVLDAGSLDLDPGVQAGILARRRRIGSYRTAGRAEHRERDIQLLVRAGFGFSVARAVIDGEPG